MLTKSNYISGIKCPKRMMLEIQNPITEDEISFEILENARELEKKIGRASGRERVSSPMNH